MRRWNGWGDESTTYPFPGSAAAYLSELVGQGKRPQDASIESILLSVPRSRLPDYGLVKYEAADRLGHARGQSLPDWIALRSGRIPAFPDGVAYPSSEEEVRQLLVFARQNDAIVIPYGGGTSVVGHINPANGRRPVLTLDLSQLQGLAFLDETSHLATFWAGTPGPQIERDLHPHGLMLGHFPQSYEYSTLGGWIATRSSGQQSYFYGRIEELFAGGRVETPAESLTLPPFPASAAGPDLRQMILGSEGRLGIITRATVRVRAIPESESFYAIFFRDWQSGVTAVRRIVQSAIPLSMMRLSDPLETETTLALAGHDRSVTWAKRGLRWMGYGAHSCLLIYGLTGNRRSVNLARRQVKGMARDAGGLAAGPFIGKRWQQSRFLAPYLRNQLWERGYAVDTLETAVPWSIAEETATRLVDCLRKGLSADGERVLAFAHLSHVYIDGASIYVTYLFRLAADPDQNLERWTQLKTTASQLIVDLGGTISHQHGVGVDHAPYLPAEKGQVGMAWLESVRRTADPAGMMNPGKLLVERE